MTPIRCPGCKARMEFVKIQPSANREPVFLDACFQCGGLWFDAKELERSAKRRPKREATPERVASRCPRCLVDLNHETLDGVPDVAFGCPRCRGLFLTGDGVDGAVRLHPTVASGEAAAEDYEAPPEPGSFDLREWSADCERCGKVMPTIEYNLLDGAFYCPWCNAERHWNPLARAQHAAAKRIGASMLKLFE